MHCYYGVSQAFTKVKVYIPVLIVLVFHNMCIIMFVLTCLAFVRHVVC